MTHYGFPKGKRFRPFQIEGEWAFPLQERGGCPPPPKSHSSINEQFQIYYISFWKAIWFPPSCQRHSSTIKQIQSSMPISFQTKNKEGDVHHLPKGTAVITSRLNLLLYYALLCSARKMASPFK